jgi:hypothetical protein
MAAARLIRVVALVIRTVLERRDRNTKAPIRAMEHMDRNTKAPIRAMERMDRNCPATAASPCPTIGSTSSCSKG